MLKVGDKIRMLDGSYAFGIKDGGYAVLTCCQQRGLFTVIRTGLSVIGDASKPNPTGQFSRTANILITDNDGGFWFVLSKFAKRISTHTITFDDGKTIIISDESFEALKEQFS